MSVVPMIILKPDTRRTRERGFAWVPKAERGRYLHSPASGSGPIARDWDEKLDGPLDSFGEIPDGYKPKGKVAKTVEKVVEKAKPKKKTDSSTK